MYSLSSVFRFLAMFVFFGAFSSSFICISASAQDTEIEGISARIEEIEIKGTSELESSQI